MGIYRYLPSSGLPESSELDEADYRTRLLAAVDRLPPLSAVLNRLLLMLNDSNASSGQIASIIEQDSVLAGSVLRCVNSAYYGLTHRVSSIRQAVTLLGFGAVRNMALAFSMRRMLARPRSASNKLNATYSQHALGCAVMTQFLAHFVHSEEVEAAFAAGLFHDIGKLLVITALPEKIRDIVAYWEAQESTYVQAEQATLGVTHPELSLAVLEKWQLPDGIQRAARYHHEPDANPAASAQPLSLAHLVHAADAYVCFYGLEVVTSPKRPARDPEPAFESIGLKERLPEFVERFQAEFSSIRSAFDTPIQ